jgi:hypothetical protein
MKTIDQSPHQQGISSPRTLDFHKVEQQRTVSHRIEVACTFSFAFVFLAHTAESRNHKKTTD